MLLSNMQRMHMHGRKPIAVVFPTAVGLGEKPSYNRPRLCATANHCCSRCAGVTKFSVYDAALLRCARARAQRAACAPRKGCVCSEGWCTATLVYSPPTLE